MQDQGRLNNYHVYQYYCWLEWVTGQDHHYMAQLHFYTLAQLELDPNWKPEHMVEVVDV